MFYEMRFFSCMYVSYYYKFEFQMKVREKIRVRSRHTRKGIVLGKMYCLVVDKL